MTRLRTRRPAAKHRLYEVPEPAPQPTPAKPFDPNGTVDCAALPTVRPPSKTAGLSPDMAQRARTLGQGPDYRDPHGLALTHRPGDAFTLIMPAVDPTPTRILPTTVTPLPHDDLWRPGFPVTAVRHTRQERRILTAPPRTATTGAEDSYESLAAYPVQWRLDPDKPLFHPRPDGTQFDATQRSFFDRWGVIGADTPPKAAVEMNTATYAVVTAGGFPSSSTQGRAS